MDTYVFKPMAMYSELLYSKEDENDKDFYADKRFYEMSPEGEDRLIHSIEYTGGYEKGVKVRTWERFYTYINKDIFMHQIEYYDMIELYGEFQDEKVYQKYTEGNEIVEYDKYYKIVTGSNGEIIVNQQGEYELLQYSEDGPAIIEYFHMGKLTKGEDGNYRYPIYKEEYYQNLNEQPDQEKPYRRIENSSDTISKKLLPHTIYYDLERQFDNTYYHYVLETIPASEEEEETLLDLFNRLDYTEKRKYRELKNLEKYTLSDMTNMQENEIIPLIINLPENDKQRNHNSAIATLFIRKYIKMTPKEKKIFKNRGSPVNLVIKDSTILDYHGQVVPELLKGFMGVNRIPLSEIYQRLKEEENDRISNWKLFTTDEQGINLTKITSIDFSQNNLLDSDALMLAKVITKLTEFVEGKLTVNLSDNRFNGLDQKYRDMLDPNLFEILRLEKVEKVILSKNSIVTDGGRHDFFIKVYKEKLLRKLIYDAPKESSESKTKDIKVPSEEQIRKVFIGSDLTMEEQNDFIKITTETHRNYFSL